MAAKVRYIPSHGGLTLGSIGVGFIGAGRISDLHAIEYLSNPHANIVALCDRDPALAVSAGRRGGCRRQ